MDIESLGIEHKYLELLRRSGVPGLEELEQAEPKELLRTLASVNARYKIVQELPSLAEIESWIELAQQAEEAADEAQAPTFDLGIPADWDGLPGDETHPPR